MARALKVTYLSRDAAVSGSAPSELSATASRFPAVFVAFFRVGAKQQTKYIDYFDEKAESERMKSTSGLAKDWRVESFAPFVKRTMCPS